MFIQHVLFYNTASTTALQFTSTYTQHTWNLKFLAKIFTHEELTQNSNELLTSDLFTFLLEPESYSMH